MNREFEIVIGLEVHVELNTKSKLFCGCKNEFGAPPNTLCCPVCTGMPGALPVMNRQAVEFAIMMGHALHCDIHATSKMDRKNYFYPDLPKAYQISQFDIPLCGRGYLDVLQDGELTRVGITRIHLEEDAGKLLHRQNTAETLLDYNRCGVPLLEIVSEPDLRTAKQAKAFMQHIHVVLQYLGISNAKMQEGNMRADVNVSVRAKGEEAYSTRCEIKNVNSFNAIYRAIEQEANRQITILKNGGYIEQQTRRWDDQNKQSYLLRSKENTQEYAYFADPDLLKFVIPAQIIQKLKEDLPELPLEKIHRFMQQFGLSEYEAVLLAEKKVHAMFFEEATMQKLCAPKLIANWMLGDLLKLLRERGQELETTKLTPTHLAEMICLIENNIISNTAGKTLLLALLEEATTPDKLVSKLKLTQINDLGSLETLIENNILKNPDAVLDYNNGKSNALGFLIGQCMKESKGKGNPALISELLLKKLRQ